MSNDAELAQAEAERRNSAPVFEPGLDIWAPGFSQHQILADDIREEIETAAEFLQGARDGLESAELLAEDRRHDLDEARAAWERADNTVRILGRAEHLAETKLVTLLKMSGLIRTAEGITTGDPARCAGPYGCGHPAAAHTRRGQISNQACMSDGCPCTGLVLRAGMGPLR